MPAFNTEPGVVGLIPAAGVARRLPSLPCSKELLPLIGQSVQRAPSLNVPMSYLLEGFRSSGICKALVGLRVGKWDIPKYFEDGESAGVHLAYVPLRNSASVTHTLCSLLPMASGEICALGFPDILFSPCPAFRPMLQRLIEDPVDVVLGLFPTHRPEKSDMVAVDPSGAVTDIRIKEPDAGLANAWTLAVWTPAFSERILAHGHVRETEHRELHIGEVFLRELREGARISSVAFPAGRMLDIGTSDDLVRAGEFPPPGG
jgi:glucose-1-phosphate thymidylyltransferase